MNVTRRTPMLAVGLAIVVTLGSCDGDDGPNCTANPSAPGCQPSPSPSPTPGQPVVLDRGEGQLPALVALFRTVATTQVGAIEVVVDWTFGTNDVDILLARGGCTLDQLVAMQCTVIGTAESATAKPERLRAANQPAGSYTVVVVNFGPDDESIAYQVVFTPGASAAGAADGAPGTSGRKPLSLIRGAAPSR